MTDQELQLEAYKILVSMLQKDDELFWKRNDVLIAINGGLLTVVGLMQKTNCANILPSLRAISIAICIIGVAVCFFWFLIGKRGEAFYNHWHEQLTYLEKQYLNPIQIFNFSEAFFIKGSVKLGETYFKIDRLSGFVKMFSAMQILSTIISIVWIGLGFYFLLYA